jgi:hypothetical protein
MLRVRTARSDDEGGGLRLSIIEEYDDGAIAFPAAKIEFRSEDGGPPRKIMRRFDAARRIATHSFFFSRQVADRLKNSKDAAVVFTRRDAVQEGALKAEEQAPVVQVFGSDGLLRLEPAAQAAKTTR